MQTVEPSRRKALAVVLAAGDGTRMKSSRPKVLHEVAGRSMLAHVLASAASANVDELAVVIAPGHDAVGAEVEKLRPGARVFVQERRLGTAHAALAARAAIAEGFDDLLILFGDTPLVTAQAVRALRESLGAGAGVSVLAFESAAPHGYGRVICDGLGRPVDIREEKDASPAERQLRLCNAGLMGIDGRCALELLEAVGQTNAQGEFYLTDVVPLAVGRGVETRVVLAGEEEALGVNDRAQLARAEALHQASLRRAVMLAGATLVAPETVFLAADAKIGRDVLIEPNVVIGPGVEIGAGAVIRAFSHLEGARVGEGAEVGPFARLRPGTGLEARAKVGNFVEVKAARVGEGAKVNHLSYIGDADVGAGANIGAGVITCNYDGFFKYRTRIGNGAFVGSNASLVAPLEIGAGAYVGSGSVVTQDVAPDALAVARGRQVEKPGWAARFRERRKAEKEGRS